MRIRRHDTPNHGVDSDRVGLAPVEVALALPLLAAMWMILHTACDVGVARSESTIAARFDAWQKVGAPASHQPLTVGGQSVSQILVPGSTHAANGGLRIGHATRTATSHLPRLLDNTVATGQHSVFDGCWDYRTLPFEKSAREHPSLRVTRRIRAFMRAGFALGVFRVLAGF